MQVEIFSPVVETKGALSLIFRKRGEGGRKTYMRSDMSLQIARLLEGLRASDERTDQVTFQICLKNKT